MTNYSERLDKILAKHNGELGVTWEDPDVVTPDTKQAFTSLIKELVAEAKPEYKYCGFHGGEGSMVDCSACNPENMVDVYRNSLLKALEEV